MYCSQCGTQVLDEAAFCHNCGSPTATALPPAVLSAQAFHPHAASRAVGRAPSWALGHLMAGESVIAAHPAGNVNYIATDRRLLRFTSRSRHDSAPYTDVSITLQRYGWGWRLFCLLVIVFGLGVAGLGVAALLDPDAPRAAAAMLFAAAVFALWIGLVGRYGYHQICVWNPEKEGIDKWRIERLRWSPRNGSLDRFAAAVSEGSEVFGGNRPELYPRPRPRPFIGDPGLKLLPVVLTSAPVIALIWLMGGSGGDLYLRASGGYKVREEALLLGIVVLPAAAGFIAGLWTNWRGTTHGALAGVCVAGGAWGYGTYRLFVEQPELGDLTTLGYLIQFLGPLAAAVIAAAAGFVGEKLRR